MASYNIQPSSSAAPVTQKERIVILDSLRGIAILGILLMNIGMFGYPSHDPFVYNETGINYYTWYIIELIPVGTQRALFSMLFGAGIILFLRNQEKRTVGLQPADYFFRRQLWLMVFSLFDVFILLWPGDILLDYALIGMIMFTFRNLPVKKLLFAAGFCFLFMLLRENRDLYFKKETIHRGELVAAIDTTRTPLTVLQKTDLSAMQEFKERTTPESRLKDADKQILLMTGSYARLYKIRTNEYLDTLVGYLFLGIWDVLTFMFLGMAFFKSGLLLGTARTSVYWWMFIIGVGGGIFLSYLRLETLIQYRFNEYEYAKNTTFSYFEITRVLRALGFLGFVMLLYKSGIFKWLFALFRPVGQMAFTNYLMQSLICGIIFYGIGFGLFGQLHRYGIYIVVGCIWLFQILLSHVWLRYFRFGPFEWLWRSLTYWKRQEMRYGEKTKKAEVFPIGIN
jgi:uncharacterized protein